MLSSKSVNFFLAAAIFTVFSSACSRLKTDTAAVNSNSASAAAENAPGSVPFSTKEPENYQAEIIITTQTEGAKSVNKIFTARNGQKQLLTTNFGEKTAVSFLKNADKSFLISAENKIYVDNTALPQFQLDETDENKSFLLIDLLNEKADTNFEKAATENNLTKYRVSLGGENLSETFVYVDENLQMPVKQEFFSGAGERKNLVYTVEMLNFKPQADDANFNIPNDCKKVSVKEFYQIMTRDQSKQ